MRNMLDCTFLRHFMIVLKRYILFWIALCFFLGSHYAFSESKIDSLKAAYVFYFSRFTEWPDVSLDKIVLCVKTDNDNIIVEFESVVEKSKKNKIPLDFVVFSDTPNLDQAILEKCNIFYQGDGHVDLDGEILDYSGLLVVTDTNDSKRKGTVNFVLNNSKLSFEIDRAKERQANIKISSKLLRLAIKVVE